VTPATPGGMRTGFRYPTRHSGLRDEAGTARMQSRLRDQEESPDLSALGTPPGLISSPAGRADVQADLTADAIRPRHQRNQAQGEERQGDEVSLQLRSCSANRERTVSDTKNVLAKGREHRAAQYVRPLVRKSELMARAPGVGRFPSRSLPARAPTAAPDRWPGRSG